MKLKLAEDNTTSPWTMDDLETALKDLKPNKSRDPEGLVNELFKKDSIGEDLKLSLLLMFYRLKKEKNVGKIHESSQYHYSTQKRFQNKMRK